MAGALAWSSVTVNEPQFVLKTSLYVFSGSRRSFGFVAPPSSRASGTVTSLQPSAPTVAVDVVVGGRSLVVVPAVSSEEPPQPAASRARARIRMGRARRTGGSYPA